MTPSQRDSVLDVALGKSTTEELLRQFGCTDGRQLGLDLLTDAFERSDAVDVDLALIVCYKFGFTRDHLPVLIRLAAADWHMKHEDVVTALAELRDPAAIPALYQATQWIPEYLDYDESRALAIKAIWGLGGMPGPESETALRQLLNSPDAILTRAARDQLQRRGSSGTG